MAYWIRFSTSCLFAVFFFSLPFPEITTFSSEMKSISSPNCPSSSNALGKSFSSFSTYTFWKTKTHKTTIRKHTPIRVFLFEGRVNKARATASPKACIMGLWQSDINTYWVLIFFFRPFLNGGKPILFILYRWRLLNGYGCLVRLLVLQLNYYYHFAGFLSSFQDRNGLRFWSKIYKKKGKRRMLVYRKSWIWKC